jgi:hypothetical protein
MTLHQVCFVTPVYLMATQMGRAPWFAAPAPNLTLSTNAIQRLLGYLLAGLCGYLWGNNRLSDNFPRTTVMTVLLNSREPAVPD